jgi:hypothetical protein
MLVLAAAAVPAIVGSSAWAAFVELSYTSEFARLFIDGEVMRYRLYANFTSEQDRVVAVRCGMGEAVTQPFYQNPFGTWTEPLEALFPIFPNLAFDTFVTIGLPSLQPGQPATAIAPGSTFGAEAFEAGWFAPVDQPYTHGPLVLIAQLTVPVPFPLTGCLCADVEIHLMWIDASGQSHESCMHIELDWKITFPCYWPHRADINHDCAVNGIDVALLLSEWDVHVDCAPFGGSGLDCPDGDMSCDGGVDGYDLAILLGEWGAVSDCQLGG